MTAGTVLEMTALSQGTLYHLMSEGRFPRPLKVGKRAVRWRAVEVEAWLEARIAEQAEREAAVG